MFVVAFKNQLRCYIKTKKNVFVFLSNQKMLTVAAEIPKKSEKAQLMGKNACVGFFTFNKT